jgi:ketosteroid isomerase-like protein
VASANVELIRSLYADWERGDYRSSEWADPEIEWTMADGPDPGTWRGVAGMAEGFRSSMGVWTDVRADVQEYRELDDERVLVLHRFTGRGKSSGVAIEQAQPSGVMGASLLHIRDGKVTRLVAYAPREEAFADLDLED